ncbi:hypothetical protein L1887_15172 [Cichorium endivia]|nr:hypothetical protein L1887_15172 [Cichorium endivia]
MVDFGALVFFRYLTYEFSIQYKMLNEENVYFANGKSEIYVPEENDKDCTDDLDIQDERVNEEDGNSEVHQNEENDKSCLIESDIQGESHNVGGESQLSNNFIGSNGSLVWIPQIDPKLIPVMNTIFNDLNDCINWYKAYAEKSGFDIRRSTERKTKSGITKAKYFICHRAGLPNTSKVDTISILHKKQVRNTNCQRTQCQAFVAFKIIPGSTRFFLWRFQQQHNHALISKDCMHLSRTKRQLDIADQSFIHKMSSLKIGATKAYRLMCVIKGGSDCVGGIETDWKNFTRDINCHIGGTDANLLIQKLQNRKDHVSYFSYEYRCDSKQLNALFWADDTSKLNYKEFGDIVSFDATYRTNRYCMVFVPFTGIDNHKRCVTFGAGLLCREDTDSYIWLLQSFLRCFGKEPVMVITDQDPAMKKAIERVFPNSRHRLCMWHITSKLPVKVSWEIMNNSQFKKDFNNIVWDANLDENDFEKRWNDLMVEYKLEDNKWLKDMFDLRRSWIPAYFRNVPLSGLMRTTSRSESENSTFNRVSHHGYTLNNFMNAFESAMERQRHNQIKLDFDTSIIIPIIKTPLEDLEKHASMVYTRKIFLTVQNDIVQSLLSCAQKSVTSGDVTDICIVKEKKQNISKKTVAKRKEDDDTEFDWNVPTREGEFKVEFNKEEITVKCSCMLFEQFGILCRHAFCVIKLYDIEEIPSRYILRRWRRDIIPTELLKRRFIYGDSSTNVDKVAYKAFSIVDKCLSSLQNDEKKLEEFIQKLEQLKIGVDEQTSDKLPTTKQGHIEKFYGVTIPEGVAVENPPIVRNKGSGTGKRLKSVLEKAIDQGQKKSRTCKRCGVQGHNSRSCSTSKNVSKE